MPTRPYDPWRDAHGAPIPQQCWIEQITTPHRSTRTLAWLTGHPHALMLVRSVPDVLTELARAGTSTRPLWPRCDAAATGPAGVLLVASGPVLRRTP